jgi:hypothetical protein
MQQPASGNIAQHGLQPTRVVVVVMRNDHAGQRPHPDGSQIRHDDALAGVAVGKRRASIVEQRVAGGANQDGGALADVDHISLESIGSDVRT